LHTSRQPAGENFARQRLRRFHCRDRRRDGQNVAFDTLMHDATFHNRTIVPLVPETVMSTIADTAETGAAPRKVDQLLAHYAQSHRNPRNEAIHFVAIPLILLSLVGLLYAAHPWVAYAFLAASMVYYARLSWVFLLAMAVVSGVALLLVRLMDDQVVSISVSIFIAAWIAQFVGHKIEGKKPSFFEDVQYLWVGPLFVLAKLFGKLGLRW
jgi:uncharacterized membrane protein YGL010W